jgi:hypothetical protein
MSYDNSNLIDYTLTRVRGMDSPLYTDRGQWAEPSIDHLRILMRSVFQDKNVARERAQPSQDWLDKYSWSNIGAKMLKAIKEVV